MKVLFDKMIEVFGIDNVILYCKMNQEACSLSNIILVEKGQKENMEMRVDEEWWEDKITELELIKNETT